jgi:hypothetical protein
MVNDLGQEFHDLKNSLSQFADDAAIWRSGINLPFVYKKLQNQMDKVVAWMNTWVFQLNTSKTVGVVFSKG